MKLRLVAFFLLFWGGTSVSPFAASNTSSPAAKNEMTKNRYNQILEEIQTVSKSMNAADIVSLGKTIDGFIVTHDSITFKDDRRAKLDLWLRALNVVGLMINSDFDPKDVPFINVQPPVGSGVSAGASPSAISDPKLRKQYEESINENAEKAKRYDLQVRLRSLESLWSEKVRSFVKTNFGANTTDLQVVKALIDKRITDKNRKEKILLIILGPKTIGSQPATLPTEEKNPPRD